MVLLCHPHPAQNSSSVLSAQQWVAMLQASTMFQRHQKHFYVPDFPMQHKGLDLLTQMQCNTCPQAGL